MTTNHIEIKSICAFDIGIKNLAYCILTNNNNLLLEKWGLINLTDNIPKCTYILKNKQHNACGKNATFCHPIDNKILFCKSHAKTYIAPDLIIHNTNKEQVCSMCKHKCCNTIDEKYYCDKHCKKMQNDYIKKNKLSNIKNRTCMKEPLFDLFTNMYKILDTLPEILKTDKIVIENQPSMDNPTMKSISLAVFCYYVHAGHTNIQFVAPSGKLKVNAELTKSILKSSCSKKKYAVTKELGVKYCEELLKSIENSNNFAGLLLNSKKKDDLCDAFLHAYYHFIGNTGLDDTTFAKKMQDYFTKKYRTVDTKENTITLV